MRLTIVLLACLLVHTTGLYAGEATPMATEPQVEARLLAISEELRCLVCQNETLAASRAELADDLRNEIRRLIREGRSDAEIMDYLVARYGDFVRYRPPVKPTTWLLWFGPFVLLVFAALALVRYLRRRTALLGTAAAADLSEAEKARVKSLLDEVGDGR